VLGLVLADCVLGAPYGGLGYTHSADNLRITARFIPLEGVTEGDSCRWVWCMDYVLVHEGGGYS